MAELVVYRSAWRRGPLALLAVLGILGLCSSSYAAGDPVVRELSDAVRQGAGKPGEISSAIRILILLTALSLIPTLLIATTSFLRVIIVLSMLRHAIGMQDTPPNAALISIALFLTLFSMMPVWSQVDEKAWQPFQQNRLSPEAALREGYQPIREFMVRQTREPDLALMVELSKGQQPETIEDVSAVQLIPAFMLSELRTAFQIGFMIFLPFLLIDIIIASVLTSLGMMMVPPVMISLPLKVLMFILIDGWNLVVRSLMGSFY
ncbi:MAG TPA: flagellar type III secretion system pore protein FliP [Rhodocyclaceae bacterium]|jgi:flagellar biosynthetic protein FliP|nr:flagellar type III secretion system pore protein FliP [Rhodocyclaceae bacterium]HNE44257.1 flagellar type III secretion system pore protein FliP [Rhodocyclaceae bacterium]HNL21304.1 flagellar type III secretion system pore protein FliP [Rhodocyclaceae bacterium]HNM81370.1 flagellar type III secretion system pore protein FliP [Rhodocyclaceae bacterium]